MPQLIPESTLSEIQFKTDIVALISQVVPLKAAGRNYKALCPFHPEKTPSFMVNPEKGIFHCFGCGAGGNVFGFLSQYENISFPEAVEILAEKAGVVISKTADGSQEIYKKNLFELMEKISHFFEKMLLKAVEAKEARSYLEKRGVNSKMIETFRLGYCPLNGPEVLKELYKLNLENGTLEKLGLLTERDGNQHLRFSGRIIFPIFDAQGRIVGFGGRALGDRLPKYLNSPDTVLFNKSQLLYGLHLAKKAMLQKSQAILVEGYLDMISVFSAGFENVAASMGTAFNENHVRLLKRYAQSMVVAYDGDLAGVEASMRALEIFLDQDMIVKIAMIPEKHDPDSWIRTKGKESFDQLIHQAPSMIDFKLDILLSRYPLKNETSKMGISKEILKTVSRLKSPILKDHYLKVISEKLEISELALREEAKKNKTSDKGSREVLEVEKEVSFPLEDDILRILFAKKELLPSIEGKLLANHFESESHKLFFQRMLENKEFIPSHFEHHVQKVLAKILFQGHPFSDPEKTLKELVTKLRINSYKRKYQELTKELSEFEKSGKNKGEISVILLKLQDIQKEIAFLNKK